MAANIEQLPQAPITPILGPLPSPLNNLVPALNLPPLQLLAAANPIQPAPESLVGRIRREPPSLYNPSR